MPRSPRRAWFTTLAAAALMGLAPGVAIAAPGDSFTDLHDTLAACTGTPAAPTAVVLTADISEPDGQLAVSCAAVIDLAGHDLSVQTIVIAAQQQLTIDDTADADGTLTVDASGAGAGIQTTDATLIVLGGTLDVTGGGFSAGIGGGYQQPGGTVRIEGGTVTAGNTAWGGAAIGGGNGGDGGDITITGGTVTAQTEDRGAAIGGGADAGFGTISITGGTVTATSGARAAAIGGGIDGGGGTVSITGGTVTATGGPRGNGIGGGPGSGAAVTISGGHVIANAPEGTGIASDPNSGTVITGGTVEVSGQRGIANDVIDNDAAAPLAIAGTAVVTVTAEYPVSKWGAETGRILLEDSAQLTLNGGRIDIPANEVPRITVADQSVLAGNPSITGSGSIDNENTILIDSDLVQVPVFGNHFQLAFDAGGGAPVPEPMTVFASSLEQAQQALPLGAERGTDQFTGWLLGDDSLTEQTTLPGTSADGAPVALDVTASWSPTSLVTGLPDDAAKITAGASVTFTPTVVDAEGAPVPTDPSTWTVAGDADATIDPSTGEVAVTATTAGTIPLTLTVPFGAGEHTAQVDLTVEAGPTASIVLTPSADTVDQGGSVEITAAGADAYGNSTGDVTGEVTLTSDVDSDVIEGSTVTFPHASPHTITGTHVGGASATVLIEVAAEAEEPTDDPTDDPTSAPTTDPTEPTSDGPTAEPTPSATSPSAQLPDTGTDGGLGRLAAAFTMLLAGAATVLLARRRRSAL